MSIDSQIKECRHYHKEKNFWFRFELAIAFLKDTNQAEKYAIAERTLSFPLKNAWILAGKYHAEALCAEAVYYDFTKSENWRCAFEKIRTDFTQNL